MQRSMPVFSAVLVVVGVSSYFVIGTSLLGEMPRAAMLAGALVAALAFVSLFAGTPSIERLRGASRRDLALAAGSGLLMWGAAPLLVLSQRSTDTPSGSETLFFSTACWGLLAVLVAFAEPGEGRSTLGQAASALLGVLGAAALLANWERPSSFSPFVKFPAREALMLAAGLLFALGAIACVRALRSIGARTAVWVGLAAALVAVAIATLFGGLGTMSTWSRLWPQVLLLGAAVGSLAVGWCALCGFAGVARSASLWLLPPAAITALAAVERAVGMRGPNPIVWVGAVAGILLSLLGAAGVWALGRQALVPAPSSPGPVQSRLAPEGEPGAVAFARPRAWVRVLAAAATLAAAASLAAPAYVATVVGELSGGGDYHVTWTMSGYESAAGWLPLAVAGLALAAAFEPPSAGSSRRGIWAACLGMAAAVAYPFLVTTPLHTWNSWIPADIQQAYGTEYARLTLAVAPDALRIASLVISAMACVAIIASGLRTVDTPASAGTDKKEHE